MIRFLRSKNGLVDCGEGTKWPFQVQPFAKAPPEDQMTDPFWVTDSIGDADRPTLRVSEEIEFFNAEGVYDGLKVRYPAFKREILNVPVGQSKASLFIADVRVLSGKLANPGPPDRALKVILYMGEPVSSLNQWRPRTHRCACDPHTVQRGAKTNLIKQPRSPYQERPKACRQTACQQRS